MSGGLHHLSLAGNDLSTIHPQLLANGIVCLSNVSTFSPYVAFKTISGHSVNLSRCRLSSEQITVLCQSNLRLSCINLSSNCLSQVKTLTKYFWGLQMGSSQFAALFEIQLKYERIMLV